MPRPLESGRPLPPPRSADGGRCRPHAHRGSPGRLRQAAGFTLVEVLLAVTILAVIVVLLAGSLRVGARAWEAGERRAIAHQELRAIVELLTDALGAAVPYRGPLGDAPERVVLFQGEPEEVRFVTTAAPLVLEAPVAPYHAVTLRRVEERLLRLTERLVPAAEPFGDTPTLVLSREVVGLRLEYRDAQGAWLERWDGRTAGTLPSAVRVGLTLRHRDRSEQSASFVVQLPLGPGST